MNRRLLLKFRCYYWCVSAHLKTIQEELNVSSSCYRELNELRDELKQCNSKEFLYKQTQNELQVGKDKIR